MCGSLLLAVLCQQVPFALLHVCVLQILRATEEGWENRNDEESTSQESQGEQTLYSSELTFLCLCSQLENLSVNQQVFLSELKSLLGDLNSSYI